MNATTHLRAALRRDLETLSATAGQIEGVLHEVAAVLDAIELGDLLAAAPADPSEARRHNAAAHRLDMLRARVQHVQDLPDTDLSVILSVMAKEAQA